MLLLCIWLGYGIVSGILMILLTIFIGINTQYKLPFYRLVQCDMVFSLLTYIFAWICRLYNLEDTKPLMIYIYHNYHFVFEISAFATHFFYHIQSVSTMLLALYRFTALKYHKAYKIWMKYYGLFYLLVVAYASAVVVPQYIFGVIQPVVYNETTDTFQFEAIHPYKLLLFGLILNTHTNIYLMVIAICGLLALRQLWIRLLSSTASPRIRSAIKQMTAIACLHTLIHLLVVLWVILIVCFYDKWDFATKSCLMLTVSDLLSLSMPYLILFIDGPARRMFLHQICSVFNFCKITTSYESEDSEASTVVMKLQCSCCC